MKKNISSKGITLIALVITIIVLLILALVTLYLVLGNNGILTRTSDAKIKRDIAYEKEWIQYEVGRSYGLDAPKLHIDIVNSNVKKNIANVTTDEATNWPLKVTYTDSGRSYLVDGNGDITPTEDVKILRSWT